MADDLNEERFEKLREYGDELRVIVHERALEDALRGVGMIFDALEGDELRDAVVRLIAELEQEVRSAKLLTAIILGSLGVPTDDETIRSLIDRAAA